MKNQSTSFDRCQNNKRFLKSMFHERAKLTELIRSMPLSKEEKVKLLKDLHKQVDEYITQFDEASKNNKELPHIDFSIKIFFDKDPIPYIFKIHDTTISPEYLDKPLQEFTQLDLIIMRNGQFQYEGKYVDLTTAIAIIYYLIYEYYLGPKNNPHKTILEYDAELSKLLQSYPGYNDLINKRPYLDDGQQTLTKLASYAFGMGEIYKYYDQYKKMYSLIRAKNEDLSTYKKIKHWESELSYKDIELLYKDIYKLLDSVTTGMIEDGLLEKYQIKAEDDTSSFICHSHSLLNNKKLLRHLHAKQLSQKGNEHRSAYYQEYSDFFYKLFERDQAQHWKKYTTKEEAYEALSILYTPELQDFIENCKRRHQHSVEIKPDNYYENIKKWLKNHPELKEFPLTN